MPALQGVPRILLMRRLDGHSLDRLRERSAFARYSRILIAQTRQEFLAENPIQTLAFSPDGRRLISGERGETVRLWDVASGKQIQTLDGHGRGDVVGCAVFLSGRLVLTGSSDKTVRLWKIPK